MAVKRAFRPIDLPHSGTLHLYQRAMIVNALTDGNSIRPWQHKRR
jgi:hypothetical protein